MANSQTDVIMAPFLELAAHYDDQSAKESASLKRMQLAEAEDWRIEGAMVCQRLYAQFAEQIRDCARRVIRDGH